MKLRIQGNSIRFRLTRSEVDSLHAIGEVSAVTAFPAAQSLRYTVRAATHAARVGAVFEARAIVVTIPAGRVRDWATGDEVSLRGSESLPGNTRLDILVEKDFACLVPRDGEDDSDMFPHPREDGEQC